MLIDVFFCFFMRYAYQCVYRPCIANTMVCYVLVIYLIILNMVKILPNIGLNNIMIKYTIHVLNSLIQNSESPLVGLNIQKIAD